MPCRAAADSVLTIQQLFLPAAGLTWEQRCLQLHEGALWAIRLLGNLRHSPGPLPSHTHGYPTSLLLAIANTPAALLHAAGQMRQSQRLQFNTRSAGTDSAEGVFSSVHSVLGKSVDGPALQVRWLGQFEKGGKAAWE